MTLDQAIAYLRDIEQALDSPAFDREAAHLALQRVITKLESHQRWLKATAAQIDARAFA